MFSGLVSPKVRKMFLEAEKFFLDNAKEAADADFNASAFGSSAPTPRSATPVPRPKPWPGGVYST